MGGGDDALIDDEGGELPEFVLVLDNDDEDMI